MEKLVKFLMENNMMISSMESCTGGAFASAVTSIPGASDVLKFSAITYSNEFKIKMGVSSDIIEKYSVYSIETAKEMSKKINDFTNSNYSVGITGKINRMDKENMFGSDNIIYVSIYNRDDDRYYTMSIETIDASREDNIRMIINSIVSLFLNVVIPNSK